jgi:hypothetical protein
MSSEEEREMRANRANEKRRQRYDEDPEYRERRLASGRDFREKTKEKLEADPEAKQKARDRARAHRWRNKYNIVDMTLEEFGRRRVRQGGVCKICKIEKPNETLCVDHDHATGMTRGLLCRKCNSGLGYFDDSLWRVLCAAGYLIGARIVACLTIPLRIAAKLNNVIDRALRRFRRKASAS